MKAKFYYLVALLALVSCTKSNGVKSDSFTISATANLETTSKAHFGEFADGHMPMLWDIGDKIQLKELYFKGENSFTLSEAIISSKVSEICAKANFTFTAEDKGADYYQFIAVYPTIKAVSRKSAPLTFTIQVPQTQTPSSSSVDPNATLLVAVSNEYDSLPENIDFHFKHATAYAKMTLLNVENPIKKVTFKAITSETSINGKSAINANWVWEVLDGNLVPTKTVSGPKQDVYINITSSGEDTVDVWFASLPIGNITSFSVSYTADDDTVYTRTIDASTDKLTLSSGVITAFSVDMSNEKLDK